jgi:PleD family two-component response regulator
MSTLLAKNSAHILRTHADSPQGLGTTVSFSLRFQKVSKAQAGDRQYTREPDPMAKFSSQENNGHEPQSGTCIDLSTIPRNELRICIAEDNAINQRIAISFVQKLGFKCDAYLDGFKTIDALERASGNGRPFHLVLMDVQMPHCDGYEGTPHDPSFHLFPLSSNQSPQPPDSSAPTQTPTSATSSSSP